MHESFHQRGLLSSKLTSPQPAVSKHEVVPRRLPVLHACARVCVCTCVCVCATLEGNLRPDDAPSSWPLRLSSRVLSPLLGDLLPFNPLPVSLPLEPEPQSQILTLSPPWALATFAGEGGRLHLQGSPASSRPVQSPDCHLTRGRQTPGQTRPPPESLNKVLLEHGCAHSLAYCPRGGDHGLQSLK